MEMNTIVSSNVKNQSSRRGWFDIYFFIMGLFFVAMAIAEYLYPLGTGADRMAVKILCGAQIAFAFIVALFTCGPAIFSRWVPISFLLLCIWLCFSGIIRTDNWSVTLYLWVMYFYWYSLFLFFYIRSRFHQEPLQVFLVLAVISLIFWIPALINSTSVIMAKEFLSKDHLRQNYVGYYIVALFPYVLMLKRKSLKIIAIALISFGSIYSLKRGAVLALTLMGLFSSFIYIYIEPGITKRARRAITLIILWGIAIAVGGWIFQANPEAIDRRLKEKSNREEVYIRSFNALGNSELIDLVIGHGDRQAEKAIHTQTHNDWFFLLYDYGIIGVILMINVYISLMWLLWKLCKLKSPLALPLVSTLILMACVQQYSIGLYLKTFGFITGCIGLVVGSYFAENHAQLKETRLI